METWFAALLFVSGIGGGVLSAMVGGASLITFPMMLAAGLPPVTAAASNLVASIPSNFAALYSDRDLMPVIDRRFVTFVAASIAGGMVGAALLLVTSQRLFEVLVPLLIGFATALFAVAAPVSRWLRARALRRGGPAIEDRGASITMMMPVSIYGGYFGAGVGVMALAVLSLSTKGDYRSANVIKNLVMGLNTVAAALVLIARDAVSWPPTLIMMAGTVFGGFLGGYLVTIVPPAAMRWVVVVMGSLLTLVFAYRYWA